MVIDTTRLREIPSSHPTPPWMADLNRHERLPTFLEGPPDAGGRLTGLSIAVIGNGSVGQNAADNLARLGVKTLLFVDRGKTKPESLLTHPVRPDEINLSKAYIAGERAKALSPETRVLVFDAPFEAMSVAALAGMSHVILATDNLAVEAAVTRACVHLGIPIAQASVYGAALLAQVRFLDPGEDASSAPCLGCGMTLREWEDFDRGTTYSCEGPGASAIPGPSPHQPPTASVPHLCALAANLAVGEVTRRCLGLGPECEGSSQLEFSGYTNRTTRSPLARNPHCPNDHTLWRVRERPDDLAAQTPGDLLRDSGYDREDSAHLSLEVEGYRFAARATCQCPTHPRIARFLADGYEPTRCFDCNEPLNAHPFYDYQRTPLKALDGLLDRTLAALGADIPRAVILRGPRGTVLHDAPVSTLLADAARSAAEAG